MKKIIIISSIVLSLISTVSSPVLSKEVYEKENCIILADLIQTIEIGRDAGMTKDEYVKIVLESKLKDIIKVVVLNNVDLVYSMKKGTKYSKGIRNTCIDKGAVVFNDA